MPNPKYIPWKFREHLFTPESITRYEQECCKDCIYRKLAAKAKIKALRHGSVIWILKDGKPINPNEIMEGKINE